MNPASNGSPRPDLWKIDETRPLIRLCAWCPDKEIRIAAVLARQPEALINHGICPACFERERADLDGE